MESGSYVRKAHPESKQVQIQLQHPRGKRATCGVALGRGRFLLGPAHKSGSIDVSIKSVEHNAVRHVEAIWANTRVQKTALFTHDRIGSWKLSAAPRAHETGWATEARWPSHRRNQGETDAGGDKPMSPRRPTMQPRLRERPSHVHPGAAAAVGRRTARPRLAVHRPAHAGPLQRARPFPAAPLWACHPGAPAAPGPAPGAGPQRADPGLSDLRPAALVPARPYRAHAAFNRLEPAMDTWCAQAKLAE